MDKEQGSFSGHILGIVMVFAVRELAGISARMIWKIAPGNTEDIASSGLIITGITALIMIPVFWLILSRRVHGKGTQSGESKTIFEWILLIPFGICAALGLNQLMNLMHFTQLPGNYESTRQVLFSGTRLISLAVLGILAPAAEELMFRGLILEHLKSVTGLKSAAVFSALLFGVYHGNAVQGIYAFLIGLLLAFVYERFGSLCAPFLFHCAANIFVYLAADVEILGHMGGMIVSCAAGILGAVLIFLYYYSKV